MTTTTRKTTRIAKDSAALAESLNGTAAKDAAIAAANAKPAPRTGPKPTTTPAGLKRPAAKPAATKAIAKPAATKPAAKPALKDEPKVKKVPESRNLPRMLVEVVAAAFADYSAEDQQRVANYLKIVTTGTDEAGHRWWVDEAYPNFPRPTHFSWNA
jgi:hypothetical protein